MNYIHRSPTQSVAALFDIRRIAEVFLPYMVQPAADTFVDSFAWSNIKLTDPLWRYLTRYLATYWAAQKVRVNTLVLAYVGASLPLIVLFAAGGQDPLLTASTETVAVEVVRALVGSIGIVAAVPLTTAVAAALVDRRLPFIPEDRDHALAPGWE